MVYKLVKELNKTPEDVYEMNYIDCLNWLSLFHEKERYVDHINRQNKNNYR